MMTSDPSIMTFGTSDLQVFSDFPASMVFKNPGVVGIKRVLGDGGFGTVYLGTLSVAVSPCAH